MPCRERKTKTQTFNQYTMRVKTLLQKRTLRAVLLILLLGVAGMTNVLAYDFEADNLLYTIVSTDPPMVSLDGHIDGTSASDELVIPETVEYEGDEYAVVAIGDYAFADCTDMYGDIDIPSSVLSIGNHAFDNSGFDGNLIIGGSVATIGSYAFANLGSTGGGLTIPNSVTEIGDHAFYQSYFDGSFALSNSVTSIGAYAFYNLTMITANPLNLSSFPLTTIGEYAFYNCKGMTGRLTLPTALTSLGAHAFEGTGFTQLNFGSTTNSQLQSIGEYAFAECTSMTGNLAFPNSLRSVGDWAFYNSKFNGNLTLRNVQTIGAHAFEQVPFNDKGLTIPASVTEIGEGAFASCFQGGSLTINANLTTIPDWAFSSCGFTAITIPNTVTTIGNNAFSYCSSVTGELTIPSTVTTIGDYAFYRTSYTGTLTIHENMASIGSDAFESCDGLTTLNYNAADCSLPEVGWVQYCGALTTLNIGENVEVIPDHAFRDCYYFTGDLVIPENIRIIGMQAFAGNNFTSIHFNAIDCESMGYNPETGSYFMVFYSNPSLQQIVIGDNVTQIPRFAFASHSSPNCTVVLGNSVEEIKRGAFYNGSEYGGITGELVIPSSVRYIRSRAFQGCWGLTGITVMAEEPPTVGDDQGTDTFDGVGKSIPVFVPCDNVDDYISASWGGFSNIHGMCDGTVTVAANPAEGGTVTGGGSFEGGSSCTVTATANEGWVFCNWEIDNTVVSSENPYTFHVKGDMDLVAHFASTDPIVFADDNVKAVCVANWDTDGDGELSYAEAAAVTNLGEAFNNNSIISSFDELQYFIGLTIIEGWTFYNCGNLTSITIPISVTFIRQGAFYLCEGLTSITSLSSVPPTLGSEVFHGIDNTIPVNVPCGYEEAYLSIGWGGFSNFNMMCSGSVFTINGNWNNPECWAEGEVPAAGSDVVVVAKAVIPNGYLAEVGSIVMSSKGSITVEDGGQFVHTSDGVQATLKKNISPYTEGERDGWHLLASPLADDVGVSQVNNLIAGNYDLYYYDEPTHYWINQKLAENNFTALENGKGYLYGNSTSQSQIGDGTNTIDKFPFYTLYDNSIGENLFLAEELASKGLADGKISSLSWYVTFSTGFLQSNLSIWMANISESELISTSHTTNDMTLVYTGAMTPEIGWNEFVFNEDSFVWDGVSNILVCFQRNNGAWQNDPVQWQSHDCGFIGTAHAHRDYDTYDMTWTNYYMETSTERANTIFRGQGTEGSPVTLSFVGDLKASNAMVNLPLSYASTDGILKGFNLVGNPFAHNVTAYTGNNLADECYRMNEAKDNLIVSEISVDSPLKPAEGFFVKATAEGAFLTFNDGAKGGTSKTGRIKLEIIENGKLIDRLIVKNDGQPLEKLTLKEKDTRIFVKNGNQDMAVVVAEGNEQPVSFKTAQNGTYTLNVNIKGMDLAYLHLIDNLTGADVDLLAMPEYTFTAKTTDYASRFRLVFVCGDDDNDIPFAYVGNGEIVITADAFDASLQVVDVMGRVIVSHDGRTRCVSTAGMPAGVYVLRLISGNDIRTQKIVIP